MSQAAAATISELESAEAEARSWLAEFERTHGRPLRVLHIGNIANNAFLNAQFLREAGVDCHVVCYDYYDPMATPEWENAEGGRPYWFVQGPYRLCLAYLHALLDNAHTRRRVLAVRLAVMRWLLAQDTTRRAGAGIKRTVRRGVGFIRWRVLYARSWTWSLARWAGRRTARALGVDRPEPPLESGLSGRARALSDEGITAATLPPGDPRRYELRRREALDLFRQRFPDRADQLTADDLAVWSVGEDWGTVLDRYDVVQCYATDPIVALQTAIRPYVAFEHGTLRDFTLADNPVSRMNAIAYREADHVFVTNGDCLAYAERLGIERYTPMIHPVDVERHERDYPDEVAAIRRRIGADVILLCPLRHDWAIKGTDVHIRALPEIVATTAGSVRLVLCAWGAEIDASRALIEELGMTDHVVWLPPLDRLGLITYMKASSVLLDQMALPHFGATAPQGLAAGIPVVMSYDPSSTEWIVDQPAPILAAFDPAGVARAVATALDPAWRADFEDRARAWIHEQHHPRRLVLEHCRVYRRLTEEDV